jgi:hypothetical protein
MLNGSKDQKTIEKRAESFLYVYGFYIENRKALIGMGLRSFCPFDVFSLPKRSLGFNPINSENLVFAPVNY